MKIRASIGTLLELGLVEEFKTLEKPRTAYLLQYSPSGCKANCRFCLQSREESSKYSGEMLGRVKWPAIELDDLLRSWRRVFARVCLQTVIKPFFAEEAVEIIRRIRDVDGDVPISLAITPVPVDTLRRAITLGVDQLGVGLDTSTQELFEKWMKPYSWSIYLRFIEKAVELLGAGNVYVHLIAGLGESVRDLVNIMKKIYAMKARVALFNYVDKHGRPGISVTDYRLIQVARYLIENGYDPDQYIDYDKRKLTREPGIELASAFYTAGCRDCNRPFYNETPSGPIYNIPSRRILEAYMNRLREEASVIGVYL